MKLAGSWRALYAAKHAAMRAVAPWEAPSSFEVQVSMHMLADTPPSTAIPQPLPTADAVSDEAAAVDEAAAADAPQTQPALCLLFLVDGSGSVTHVRVCASSGLLPKNITTTTCSELPMGRV